MRLPMGHWYPVLESRELKRKPLGVERFAQRLVFWRTADGQPHAQAERCPHLGAALSGGTVVNDRLVCPFHGFTFDGGGTCEHIPSIGHRGKVPKGMAVRCFPTREAHGFIWLWLGGKRDIYPDPPFFPQLDSKWRFGSVSAEWPVHYTRAIENQLDVAHLPFVHRTTIGAGGRTLVEGPYVEADLSGIKVWVTTARDEGQSPRTLAELQAAAKGTEPGLTFLFPAIWLLNISARLKLFVAFVPINQGRTRYYLRTYHRFLNPVIAKPYELLMGIGNRIILNQDLRVVSTQEPNDSMDAVDDRLVEADRAIGQFRRLHSLLLEHDDDTKGAG